MDRKREANQGQDGRRKEKKGIRGGKCPTTHRITEGTPEEIDSNDLGIAAANIRKGQGRGNNEEPEGYEKIKNEKERKNGTPERSFKSRRKQIQ